MARTVWNTSTVYYTKFISSLSWCILVTPQVSETVTSCRHLPKLYFLLSYLTLFYAYSCLIQHVRAMSAHSVGEIVDSS